MENTKSYAYGDSLSKTKLPGTGPILMDFLLKGQFDIEVQLYGSWTDWGHGTPMKKKEDGLGLAATVPLLPGFYEYKYKTEKEEWFVDEDKGTVPNPYGTANNTLLVPNLPPSASEATPEVKAPSAATNEALLEAIDKATSKAANTTPLPMEASPGSAPSVAAKKARSEAADQPKKTTSRWQNLRAFMRRLKFWKKKGTKKM